MATTRRSDFPTEAGWPDAPPGRDIVLHTRVVTDTGGGPDKTILLSASFLDQTNYWLAAAYMHPPDDPGFDAIRKRAADCRCPFISIPDKGPLDRTPLRTMLAVCRHYGVKIWHGHDYKSNLLGLMLRPFWKSMKLVTTVHGWVKHTNRTPLYYAVDRWSLPYYHHVICVSENLYEQMMKLKVPPERCSLIHNAIDHEVFTRQGPAAGAPMRRSMGVPEGRLVVGAVGRLSPEKGYGDLIRAAHKLRGQGLDFEIWIAGEGQSRSDLQRLIRHLGLEERVKLLGFVTDMMGFYEAMDLFVLSSLREGLPNVVLEAMSMSVPVIATQVAGVPRLITDNDNGLLCPIGQSNQLAAAMHRLLTDPALHRRFTDAARQRIEREYSFQHRMSKIKAVYDSVLARHLPAVNESPSPAEWRKVRL